MNKFWLPTISIVFLRIEDYISVVKYFTIIYLFVMDQVDGGKQDRYSILDELRF